MDYISYCSQAKDGRFSPTQVTAKVNYKLDSHYL